ncbi:MAG: hypothetical protein LC772_02490, partial [Chloroflexi bacterium]|nr:hypothetical protein [Chloroflexota bacterium]
MKNTAGIYLAFLVLLTVSAPWVRAAAGPATPVISRLKDGTVGAAGQGYTALIDSRGYLASYRVDGVETVGAPFSYQPGAHLVEDAVTTSDDRITVHLKGAGEATISYDFRPDGFTITPTWKGNGYAEFRFTASPSLTGIELLNYKGNTAGGVATRFVDHGEIRGVPAVTSSSNQMVRFHYPSLNLKAYVQAWGAPFNYESAGIIHDYTWGRPLLEANRAFPIVFRIERIPPGPHLHALPFVPRSGKVASLYYTEEPCVWSLDLGGREATQYLLDAGVRSLRVDWTLLDFHDAPVSAGHSQFSLLSGAAHPVQPVTVRPPGSGYYSVIFRLSDGSGRMLESSFRTRCTVIHRVEGMVNRDDLLLHTSPSDYAVMGMIGAGAIRESHPASEFFTQSTPSGQGWERVEGAVPTVWMNGAALDRVFGAAAEESARYHE